MFDTIRKAFLGASELEATDHATREAAIAFENKIADDAHRAHELDMQRRNREAAEARDARKREAAERAAAKRADLDASLATAFFEASTSILTEFRDTPTRPIAVRFRALVGDTAAALARQIYAHNDSVADLVLLAFCRVIGRAPTLDSPTMHAAHGFARRFVEADLAHAAELHTCLVEIERAVERITTLHDPENEQHAIAFGHACRSSRAQHHERHRLETNLAREKRLRAERERDFVEVKIADGSFVTFRRGSPEHLDALARERGRNDPTHRHYTSSIGYEVKGDRALGDSPITSTGSDLASKPS